MEKVYGLGIDYGTNSSRALVFDLTNGEEIASAVEVYPSGNMGIIETASNPHLARQNPADYLTAMEKAVKATVAKAESKGVDLSKIVGIGVDGTGSTPIPVDEKLVPIAFQEKFKNNPNAYAWLWKDHTAKKEAEEITALAAAIRPEYLKKCGGSYSSEWFFSKILKCLRTDKEVFNAAYTWLELSDYIPAVLAGITNNKELKRNVCASGHKAMFNKDWGGLPDAEFLKKLAPELADLRTRLFNDAYTFADQVGTLSKEWASKLGLPAGIPIAVGALDAHVGAIGSGVGNETLVQIIGTSSCDIMAFPEEKGIDDIMGVSGVVNGSVLPGYIGVEGGQSAVGDIYNWYIDKVLQRDGSYHTEMTKKAETLRAGESGLLALDWNNGNRNILADPELTGLLVGQTLYTRDYEIYRALIEATAFGTLAIIDQIESYGIKIDKIVNCGGIAQKNGMVMQIYANVLNRPMEIAESDQTVAAGAAIMGGYCALKGKKGFETVTEIQNRCCKVKDKAYKPQREEAYTYQRLFALYKQLHNAFGRAGEYNLSGVMKGLLDIKKEVTIPEGALV